MKEVGRRAGESAGNEQGATVGNGGEGHTLFLYP